MKYYNWNPSSQLNQKKENREVTQPRIRLKALSAKMFNRHSQILIEIQ